MAKKTNTEVATVETKKAVPAKTEKTNAEKVNEILIMEDINKLYADLGIKCYNPAAKGKYRIMGNQKGSSLNVTKKEYKIFSTDEDTKLVQEAVMNGLKGVEVITGDNSQDKTRPNTIRCTTVEALKALLKVCATNVFNQVVSETAVAVKEA